MPVISAFFGILIRMYFEDHEPPHFHAEHQGDHATFSFDGNLLAGGIRSGAARRRIAAWALVHRSDLEANWRRIRAGRPLERIPPLA